MESISVVALYPNGSSIQGYLYTFNNKKQLFFNYLGVNVALPPKTILLDFKKSKFMVVPTYKEAMNHKNRILLIYGTKLGTRQEVIAAAKYTSKINRK